MDEQIEEKKEEVLMSDDDNQSSSSLLLPQLIEEASTEEVVIDENPKNIKKLKKVLKENIKKANGNVLLAYKMTFPDVMGKLAEFENEAVTAKIPTELQDGLPDNAKLASVIKKALTSKVEDPISWNEKHKFLETALKLKGLIGPGHEGNKTQINIGTFIKE